MFDRSTPIAVFLDALAARQPTPGGGSVAALTGALAAATGEMVVNYSLGKKELAPYAGELEPVLEQLQRARDMLLELMVEDQGVYQALSAARKIPESDPQRKEKIDAALLAAIRAPEAIGAAAVAILDVCDRIINFVNFHLLSDLAVSADLAMATTRCAVYNVRVNLTGLTDPADRQRIESTISQLLTRAAALIQKVGPRIRARQEQGS
ncbi:MAG TPA: cyclodeaminase/cyclohydrolase family protein [Tepidisphaeraceae bacterium]|jgi:formiminotetrahydrofolate cyclodeaminase|nr:cyclodeaminase/cyclohydrolase family protein [Tepidisphaeraceae bacterium]